jgi:molybdopterin-guanine dinucleotide biosynthesis protein A
MGQNKAFLTFEGRTLIEIAADAVAQTAGNVTIIGSPETYRHLGFRVEPDLRTGAGPLAGIETALSVSAVPWALVVACDMPRLTPAILRHILEEAWSRPDILAVLPETSPGRVEPLCAAYNRSALPIITQALDGGTRRVTSAFPPHRIHYVRTPEIDVFQNLNTPEEWRIALESR